MYYLLRCTTFNICSISSLFFLIPLYVLCVCVCVCVYIYTRPHTQTQSIVYVFNEPVTSNCKHLFLYLSYFRGAVVNNSPADVGDAKDVDLIPE